VSGADTPPLRPLLLLAGAGFVSGASMRIAEPLLPVLAHDFGGSVRHASIVLAAFTFAYGAFQIVHGPLGDRVGKLRLVAVALAPDTPDHRVRAAGRLAPRRQSLKAGNDVGHRRHPFQAVIAARPAIASG